MPLCPDPTGAPMSLWLLHLLIHPLIVATAVLSGIFGMAGGMVLMAGLLVLLPVPAAMILHGVAQGTANGTRAWLLRRHVRWSILPGYAVGAVLAFGLLAWLLWVPPRGVVLMVIGASPWLARFSRTLGGLSIEHPSTAIGCGFVVTSAQVLAGASGPLLDVFYLQTRLDRYQIIASKAFTQTVGHVLKLAYYGLLVSTAPPHASLLVLAVVMAGAGTWLGRQVLERLTEASFRRWSGRIVLGLGTVAMLAGLMDLLDVGFSR